MPETGFRTLPMQYYVRTWPTGYKKNTLRDLFVESFSLHTWANQVSENAAMTTWKVTQDIVSWKLCTEESPEIPSWYRFSVDKQFVTCLK
jgi:hypothetical protein